MPDTLPAIGITSTSFSIQKPNIGLVLMSYRGHGIAGQQPDVRADAFPGHCSVPLRRCWVQSRVLFIPPPSRSVARTALGWPPTAKQWQRVSGQNVRAWLGMHAAAEPFFSLQPRRAAENQELAGVGKKQGDKSSSCLLTGPCLYSEMVLAHSCCGFLSRGS